MLEVGTSRTPVYPAHYGSKGDCRGIGVSFRDLWVFLEPESVVFDDLLRAFLVFQRHAKDFRRDPSIPEGSCRNSSLGSYAQ